MKLISIKIEANLPFGLGSLGNIVCDAPEHKLKGWKVDVRGPAVFLVSPPGWSPTPQPGERPTSGPVTVFEIPRIQCVMRWEGADSMDNAQKHATPPMYSPADRAAMEAAELDRATAPGAQVKK